MKKKEKIEKNIEASGVKPRTREVITDFYLKRGACPWAHTPLSNLEHGRTEPAAWKASLPTVGDKSYV